MKASNRVMLIALAVVAVMLFASVIAGRIVLERMMTQVEAFKEISDEDRKEVHQSWGYLSYRGEVAHERVSTSGVSSVKRR